MKLGFIFLQSKSPVVDTVLSLYLLAPSCSTKIAPVCLALRVCDSCVFCLIPLSPTQALVGLKIYGSLPLCFLLQTIVSGGRFHVRF